MTEHLRIRMYNVGFGDCFVIIIPGKPKRAILVDAGFHSQGKGRFSQAELTAQVLGDLKALTGRMRADVVIGTHRHQDHITAFNAAGWEQLEVGEVWLPWVEDPDNDAAKKLWKKRAAFAEALTRALPGFAAALSADAKEDIAFALWNAGVSHDELAAFAGWPVAAEPMHAVSNANALECLRTGFARRDVDTPRYLPVGEAIPEAFESKMLPGVRAYVLGPPRDPALMSEGNPEADGESYRALALRAAEGADGDTPCAPPFGALWVVDRRTPGSPLHASERETLDKLARDVDAGFAAASLDSAINATSLVLVLQIGSVRLLLPGDAEWGTWRQILAEPKAVALLKGTTFLKVGHHGSHNATPKTLVEQLLPRRVRAMISTQQGKGQFRNNIPIQGLLDALRDHHIAHARSDRGSEIAAPFSSGDDDKWIDLEIPMAGEPAHTS